MKVRIVNRSRNALPLYQTPLSAGMDVRADLEQSVTLAPLGRAMIPTGLYVELPEGYEMQVRPRSGLAAKRGITVLHSPGTIDADYRGEIGIILINFSNEDFVINDGERICQMVVKEYCRVDWVEVQPLEDSDRGAGGFGHTGVK